MIYVITIIESRMNNPYTCTLAILGTQDTEQRPTKQKDHTNTHTHHNTTHNSKKMSNMDPITQPAGAQVFAKGMKFLLLIEHSFDLKL